MNIGRGGGGGGGGTLYTMTTALYGDGFVSRLVKVCALFVPTEGSHF